MRKIRPLLKNIRSKLVRFQEDYPHWKTNLRGACVTSSIMVAQELSQQKIAFSIVKGKRGLIDHVWIETENHLIDLTSTQFDAKSPEILILNKKTKKYQDFLNQFTYNYNTDLLDLKEWNQKENPFVCLRKMKAKGIDVSIIENRKITELSMKWKR